MSDITITRDNLIKLVNRTFDDYAMGMINCYECNEIIISALSHDTYVSKANELVGNWDIKK